MQHTTTIVNITLSVCDQLQPLTLHEAGHVTFLQDGVC